MADFYKRIYKEERLISKAEHQGTCEYEIPPPMRAALDAELDAIEAIIKGMLPAVTDTTKPEIRRVVKSLQGAGTRSIRRLLDLHTCKRITNTTVNLAVRIFGAPKMPSKPMLVEFLSSFGAVSLKKSEKTKMYIATLPSFEAFDEICELGHVEIGAGTAINIKPFQMIGPPEKFQHKKKKKEILGCVYQAKSGQPPAPNAPKPKPSNEEFEIDDDAMMLDEGGSDVDYEGVPMEELEDY